MWFEARITGPSFGTWCLAALVDLPAPVEPRLGVPAQGPQAVLGQAARSGEVDGREELVAHGVPARVTSSTRATMASTTWSSVRWVPSISIASGALASGEAARVESISSRRARSSLRGGGVDAAELGGTAGGSGGRVGDQVDLDRCIGDNGRADVASLDDDAAR